MRARDVLTNESQSRLGLWPGCVMISTMSPFRSFVSQRHHAAIDLRADAAVADFGVNRVGEIDRRRVARQRDDFAFRREGVNLFGIQVDLQRAQEIRRVLHFLLPLDEMPQPGDALIFAVVGDELAVFVFPVRGDAFFGDAVHFGRSDLHFERLARRR